MLFLSLHIFRYEGFLIHGRCGFWFFNRSIAVIIVLNVNIVGKSSAFIPILLSCCFRNTSISMVTKPTPPQHLRAIQSRSRSSLSQNVPVLKNLPQSSTSDHQPNVIQPDMLPCHSKSIMETSAQGLN